jgi:hypothetical protein
MEGPSPGRGAVAVADRCCCYCCCWPMLWVKSGWWGSDGRTAGVEIRLEELGKQWVSGETLRAGV